MAEKTIKYYGKLGDTRAVKIVWIGDEMAYGCIAELSDQGRQYGVPVLRIAGKDDQKLMNSIYAFRSFAPEISADQFKEVAEKVALAMDSFDPDAPVLDGMIQTELTPG